MLSRWGIVAYNLLPYSVFSDFFNNDVLPIVYDRGSLGASGDLAPLANLFLPLIGVGDVNYKGKKCEAISVLDEFGWEPSGS